MEILNIHLGFLDREISVMIEDNHHRKYQKYRYSLNKKQDEYDH